MKYELIGKNNLLSPIETVLKNRGIEDIQSFLNIDEKVIIHWSKLKNIEKAVNCLLDHIEKDSNIFIQVDADPDGYTSATLLIKYLTNTFPGIKLSWRLHDGKEHGIILETVPKETNLVITPDSGSNQFNEHKQLKEQGIDVIILDHHECNEESKDAIVVNSQISPEYGNKQFSGVGITYKFCKALDEFLKIKHADNYLDLVAVGNIADSQDMRTPETRYYVAKGLKKVKNKFLKALYKKQEFSTKGIKNITTTGFYIVPLINACIRVGDLQEKEQMFRAFLESNETIYYKKKDIQEPIEENTARMLGNLKAKQDRIRNKALEDIQAKIEDKGLLNNKILIVEVSDILHKNLTGVVANKCAETYKRPTILLRFDNEGEFLTGSIRGYEKSVITDFKSFLKGIDKFEFVEGHANAAGCKVKPENLIVANEIINEKLKDVEVNMDLYHVDFIVPVKKLKSQFISDLNKHKHLWGQNIDEPLIAIKDIEVNKDEVYLNGKTSKTIKFISSGIEFIKFFSNEEEWNSIVSKGERLVIDVVGKCSINEYQGKITPQVVIEDFEVVKVKKKEIVF